jgi:adenylosuccinate lyase
MQPLSPLDGRYASKVQVLRPFFTEDALNRARILVEVQYFIALAEEKGIPELRPLSEREKTALLKIVEDFGDKEAQKVRDIEKTTNHDVKAVEYYLRSQFEKIGGAKMKTEFIHFALTSEDVNNLAYGVLINDALKRVLRPELSAVISALKAIAGPNMRRPMLSLTHGQPATPTTLGKEMMVFVERLERQRKELVQFSMCGKFGGAVGNYFAHRSAYPDLNWEAFGKRFIRSLKLDPLSHTTQINPHDDIAELSHVYARINTILIDLSRDIWMYISRGIFSQKVIKGEVGSSTMPHKVNPIDFENAEGNLGLSTALFLHFGEKLPVSRLQRDLSDSTVQRNIGVAFGYHFLALQSLQKGLQKLSVNTEVMADELHAHPEVLTEAIQTVMRKNGFSDAYERMKAMSRGKRVTLGDLRSFVAGLDIAKADKERLQKLLK